MKSNAGKLQWRPFALATIAMIASIWVFAAIADLADAQNAPDHSDLEHSHGFTGPGGVENWPPRPTGASSDMEAADAGVTAFATQAPALSAFQADSAPEMPSEMAAALGEDWLHISTVEAKSGKDDSTPQERTYFSRSLNQTVIVLDWPAGPEVVTFDPTQLQPVITAIEEAEAAELGRLWLLEQGLDGVSELEGFGIRALDDGELHPVRMVYITYASSWFDDPLFSALVDLTNGVVVEGGAL